MDMRQLGEIKAGWEFIMPLPSLCRTGGTGIHRVACVTLFAFLALQCGVASHLIVVPVFVIAF